MKPTFTHLSRTGLLLACLSLALAPSCKKADTPPSGQDSTFTVVSEGLEAEVYYDDLLTIFLQNANNNGLARVSGSTCPVFYVTPADSSTFPKSILIDFGTACTDPNGRTRSGRLQAQLSGPISDSGSVLQIEPDSFYVDGVHVEGKETLTTLSSAGKLVFGVRVSSGLLTWPDGRTLQDSSQFVLTQTAGMGTTSFLDDVYQVTGDSYLVLADRSTLGMHVSAGLEKSLLCEDYISGILEVTYQNQTASIDFGNGTCDNKATVTVGNQSQVVTLPR